MRPGGYLGMKTPHGEDRSRDRVPSLRFETRDSASMLFRAVDIDLAAYPMLAWRWFIELPIKSPLDERTREGRRSPGAALSSVHHRSRREPCDGGDLGQSAETGDYKYIGGFPHFVADAGDDRVGRWPDERIDLAHVYAEIRRGCRTRAPGRCRRVLRKRRHAYRQHQLLRLRPT